MHLTITGPKMRSLCRCLSPSNSCDVATPAALAAAQALPNEQPLMHAPSDT
jgi:hypothetical protein